MRMNPSPRVRAFPHEQPHHFGAPPDHGVVDRAVFVAVGKRHAGKLGPGVQHGSHAFDVSGANGFDQPPNGYPVNVSLELRPAIEAVATCHD